ncbi:hypothetical protein M409DRAFT_70579 [Zasmidium cellare ATCC 36951]|uniref:CENP-V/GFA domain-containing protein n=1 Tax=Zasmidium cellare ATCC 36951 TaxID=1080233 RepID=A0A6A6BZT6_ZASCE|nr:uncharacterized protein M409DRAFT_70579 [Zasmidium cellare ATCC 36951]KAF2160225.1 hypothetical protein M409DRAFT_70579 [Zasmidium cellare ATCC 36951]
MSTSNNQEKNLTGSCACGSCTYTSTSPATHLDYCYCIQCQRISGAPFIAWMGVPRSTLTFSGPIVHVHLSKIATRGFCEKCGAGLSLQYECYPEKTHVAAGTVVRSDFGIPEVGIHIFVKSRPAWHRIAEDGVPRYEEFDEEFEERFPEVVKELRKLAE